MTATENADRRQELLNLINHESASAFLALAWRTTAPDYRVALVDLGDDVSQPFLNYARRASERLAGGTHIDYDPEWPLREHEYFELTKPEFPTTNLFDELADFQNLTPFKRKNLTKPKLYVVAVQLSGQVALFGKRMAYLQVLKPGTGVFSAVWDGSTFNALADSVATFSQTFDWIVWQDTLFIQDAVGFHAEFRDAEVLKQAVASHVEGICDKVNIVNAAAMVQRCQSNVPMASKLKRISARGMHLTSSVTELKGYATEYNIDIQWQGDDLVFDGSLEGQWNILKLLDEDRTSGPLSQRHYEAAKKREV